MKKKADASNKTQKFLQHKRMVRGEWIELNVGSFQTEKGKTGEVCFGLCDHRGHWKRGLIIKAPSSGQEIEQSL
ncbi:hypothetical protein PVL29_019388 [Vitis rotundifolia]|uniref:Uncharacterized protein n=1 Tax=Vitis rotundifolia TaxID=103349 RepID=A0AA38Z0K8_VITRO|nr:hypothetical protein PVL29_019388 [Vitis rotundifolia]